MQCLAPHLKEPKHIKHVVCLLLPFLDRMLLVSENEDMEARRRFRVVEAIKEKRPSNCTLLYTLLDYLASAMLCLARKLYDKDLYCRLICLLATEGMNSHFSVIYFLHFECPNKCEVAVQQMIKCAQRGSVIHSDVFDEVARLVDAKQLKQTDYKKATLYFEHALIPLFAAYCRQSHDFSFITEEHVRLLRRIATTSISLAQQAILFLSLYTSHKGLSSLTSCFSKEFIQQLSDKNPFITPQLLLLLAQLMEPTEQSFQYFCEQFLRSLHYASAIPVCLKAISVFLRQITEDETKARINAMVEKKIVAPHAVVDASPFLKLLSYNPVFFSSTITKLTRCEDAVLTPKLPHMGFITFCELVLPFSRRNDEYFTYLFKEYLNTSSTLFSLLHRKSCAQMLKYIARQPVTIDGDRLCDAVDAYDALKKRQGARKSAVGERSASFYSLFSRKVLLDVMVMVMEQGQERLRVQNGQRLLRFVQELVAFVDHNGAFAVLSRFLSCPSRPLSSPLVFPDIADEALQNQCIVLLLTVIASSVVSVAGVAGQPQQNCLWRHVHLAAVLLQKCSGVQADAAAQFTEVVKQVATAYVKAERARRSEQFSPLSQPESCLPSVPYAHFFSSQRSISFKSLFGSYKVSSFAGTELSYALFTLLSQPALLPSLFILVRQDVIPLVLTLLKEEGMVVHTHTLLQTLRDYITIPGIRLTPDETAAVLHQMARLAELPPILENQYALQLVARITQTLESTVLASSPSHAQPSLDSLLKQAVSASPAVRENALQQLKLRLPAGLFARLDALFASQFARLGKEQWLPLLAFVLLDAVAEGEVSLADPAFLLPSLAYPLNRRGEYEIMVRGELHDWEVKKEAILFIERVNASLAAIASCKPAALFTALEDVLFLDSVITEKWGCWGVLKSRLLLQLLPCVFSMPAARPLLPKIEAFLCSDACHASFPFYHSFSLQPLWFSYRSHFPVSPFLLSSSPSLLPQFNPVQLLLEGLFSSSTVPVFARETLLFVATQYGCSDLVSFFLTRFIPQLNDVEDVPWHLCLYDVYVGVERASEA